MICLESIQPFVWKIETFIKKYKIQEILYIGQWCLSPFQSSTLGPHTVLSIAINCPIVFSWISLKFWNLFPSKGDFTFEKSWKLQGVKSGCRGPGSPRWFDDLPKNCTRCDAWASALLWRSCQSPGAHSYGLLNHRNSFWGGMFKLNAKFDDDSLLYLLSHFECDGHTVHMLTQWCLPPPLTGTVKSSLFIHAHFSPLSVAARLPRCRTNHSCYIYSGWTFSGQTSYTAKRLPQ